MSDRVPLLVLRDVRAVDPQGELDARVDVVIEQGRIAAIGVGAGAEAARSERARVIDAAGNWLLPAFVDLRSHLGEPGSESREDIASGLAAAAAGGYAHVCAMPGTRPVNDSRFVTQRLLDRATQARGARLHPVAALTKNLEGRELSEMAELADAGAVAVSNDAVPITSSLVMRKALEYARNFDLPVLGHCEDPVLTQGAEMHEGSVSARLGLRGAPRVAEDLVVARDLALAELTGTRYHVGHVSTAGAIALVRAAKARGARVTAEVTPHHLLLTDALCEDYATHAKVMPPLREASDVEALVAALADGTLDAIATDHTPVSLAEWDCPFTEARAGFIGLELAFAALLELVASDRVPLARLVHAFSAGPARVIGLSPPRIEVDAVAELVLVDPNRRWRPRDARLASKSRNSPLLERELEGHVDLTIVAGRLAHDALA